ncbi:Abi family protein [Helcococcus kunzii]|uniref:Abi-like protein n=1 Tax=Helcococcus kunzii ATCC 51366 TaxID=883114 RepID=H3NPT6_9FIRM|nr:Abi family protein [Helcococcus kunzii]EHR33314.1 hypothetical protein HMPREF9709_01358 [Helcococcus kunzii ATCC 51366]MCT1795970.1 Abi family protein [Helcococcus kunzii]MCT1988254.1 Abi family protein [Helcococcus kunzii]QUY65254.1 Abi family protein [Helcococcus kunzii]
MSDYFKTIDEQIKILKQRNLVIEDEQHARECLLRYNYYKIINGTYQYFSQDSPDVRNKKSSYRDGTDFQDLMDVHNFDKQLKRVLLGAMLEIERISRSIISYKFVEKYPKPGAYLNPKNYSHTDRGYVLTNIDSINETIKSFMNEENYNRSIKYYLDKYNSIPFWFIINFVSFGKIVNIYETLDYQLREDIADAFQLIVEDNIGHKLEKFLTPTQLQSFLQNAKDIRNVSAHDNLILGYKFSRIEYFAPIHDNYEIKDNDERNTLFDTLIILQALLPSEIFSETQEKINEEINKLKENVDEIAFNKIIKSIGYNKVKF